MLPTTQPSLRSYALLILTNGVISEEEERDGGDEGDGGDDGGDYCDRDGLARVSNTNTSASLRVLLPASLDLRVAACWLCLLCVFLSCPPSAFILVDVLALFLLVVSSLGSLKYRYLSYEPRKGAQETRVCHWPIGHCPKAKAGANALVGTLTLQGTPLINAPPMEKRRLQARLAKRSFLFGHLFFNITNVFCAKKRVGHACICPRMDTG